MPHQKRVRHRVADLVKKRPGIIGALFTTVIVMNGTVATVCGIAIGLAVAVFLCSVSALLCRAVLKPDDRCFERTVYLLKLVCLYGPRALLAEPSDRVTDAFISAVAVEPPPSRMPHCPECLLHGEGLKH
ncbi:hypothetical protein Nocox_02740 [Nonomuraea coxensis DSM 45129]|uniref:Uncharacterized protein n=1 Tax=Nonomuraea coxensis DSM 45129 TaxID=1122611 RepID=A0ABX8TRR9_9ACTN|nr:hypothetical protein [Nonomuraea coxensis]QYC38180.1 hypothetical protein Nocox_02740 [Nonomuraea coxensis DSM 45129]